MSDNPGQTRKIRRRSMLSGAVMFGGGALISATVPSRLLQSGNAAGRGHALDELANTRALQEPTVRSAASAPARFSPEFLANKTFQDLPLNFDPAPALMVNGEPIETGAFLQENGDVLFKVFAPYAQNVQLKTATGPGRESEFRLTKQANGVFQGRLVYNETATGPVHVQVKVDGVPTIDPYLPVQWTSGARNIVEVPDGALDFVQIKNVPHGAVGREIYWVEALNSWERCFVYTPPGYMNGREEYPVLYLLHGGGDNETSWEYAGKVAHILDNLISERKANPFVVVMNNGMLRYKTTKPPVVDEAFERLLTQSCIPYIGKTYRVKTGKWNRAIGGLSMGSYMSCDIGFRHPELFGNIGTFTASMTHESSFPTTYERPYRRVMQDPAKFVNDYKVYFRSTTPLEDHISYFYADDKICTDAGIDRLPSYHRILYPERTSKWNSWRMGLRDYAKLLFR